jgi:hypothetical protein
MKNYIIIYPNTNPNHISEICRNLINIKSDNKLDAIGDAIHNIPEGYPFLIIENTEYDIMFHEAYSVDFSNPDGYGTNTKVLKSLKLTGFTDWDKNK